jgi:CrcB protein
VSLVAASVVAGSALGAVSRFLVDLALRSRGETVLPWGTLTVNTSGSFVLGAVTAAVLSGALADPAAAALGTGFCGALTTFSTLGYETLLLAESGARARALLYVALTVVAGLGAAVVGWGLGTALLG